MIKIIPKLKKKEKNRLYQHDKNNSQIGVYIKVVVTCVIRYPLCVTSQYRLQ